MTFKLFAGIHNNHQNVVALEMKRRLIADLVMMMMMILMMMMMLLMILMISLISMMSMMLMMIMTMMAMLTFTIIITFKDLRREDEEEIVVEHPSLGNLFKEKSNLFGTIKCNVSFCLVQTFCCL